MSVQNGRSPPVRTPDPLSSTRRRALRRLGSLRTMGLGAIGDIGSVAFGTVNTLTWETAADWDASVDENGVVHENTANTDHTDASTIKKGYSAASPPFPTNLEGYWLFNEDSGSTAFDFSGNNYDGTITGATIGATGPLGTTVYSLDGADDRIDMGDQSLLDPGSGPFTWIAVVRTGEISSRQYIVNKSESGSSARRAALRQGSGDEFELELDDNSSFIRATSTTSASVGTWNHVAGVRQADDDLRIHVDGGTAEGTASPGSYGSVSNTRPFRVGEQSASGGDDYEGRIGYVFAYYTDLSTSQITNHADTIFGESFLQTATKSFSGPQQPDLSSLSYNLNGESITLDVIGSPGGGGEEVVSQVLDGSSAYALTWSNSHTDFAIKPRLSTSTVTTTPTFSAGTLTT